MDLIHQPTHDIEAETALSAFLQIALQVWIKHAGRIERRSVIAQLDRQPIVGDVEPITAEALTIPHR